MLNKFTDLTFYMYAWTNVSLIYLKTHVWHTRGMPVEDHTWYTGALKQHTSITFVSQVMFLLPPSNLEIKWLLSYV